jgi:hypothetical protein
LPALAKVFHRPKVAPKPRQNLDIALFMPYSQRLIVIRK